MTSDKIRWTPIGLCPIAYKQTNCRLFCHSMRLFTTTPGFNSNKPTQTRDTTQFSQRAPYINHKQMFHVTSLPSTRDVIGTGPERHVDYLATGGVTSDNHWPRNGFRDVVHSPTSRTWLSQITGATQVERLRAFKQLSSDQYLFFVILNGHPAWPSFIRYGHCYVNINVSDNRVLSLLQHIPRVENILTSYRVSLD